MVLHKFPDNLFWNARVDAVVATHPYIDTITDRLGSNAVVLPAQNNKYTYER